MSTHGPSRIRIASEWVRFSELDGKPFALLGSEFTTRRLIDRYFMEGGATPNVVCETNSMEVMLGAVTEGAVCALMPEYSVRGLDPRYRTIRLRHPAPARTSALLWPKHSFRSASARTFGQMMRDRFLTR